jgi:predicted nucleic acid-binding protein
LILVDTSVWIDHFRRVDDRLAELLDRNQVLMHPFVTGELAMGNLRLRDVILQDLRDLPPAAIAAEDEVLRMIGQERLYGLGLGYVDAHLLASARLTPDALLWTRDRRLAVAAERLSLAMLSAH